LISGFHISRDCQPSHLAPVSASLLEHCSVPPAPLPVAEAELYLDLDAFKVVNHREGPFAGDTVLREATTILNGVVSEQDVAARFGGDEFAVLLNNDPAEAASFHVVPSGVDKAVGAADALVYGAKMSGKNQVLHHACQSA
jgi:PleD family two-component response regulator